MRIASLNTYTASRMNQSFKAEPLSSYTVKDRDDFGELKIYNVTSSAEDIAFLKTMQKNVPIEKLKPKYSSSKTLFCKNLIENGIKTKLNNLNMKFLLAVKDDKPVGMMVYDKSREVNSGLELKYFVTWPSRPGKSKEAAGSCLMNELFSDSRGKGIKSITVTPPTDYIETTLFYDKMGFEFSEESMFCNVSFMEIFKNSIDGKLSDLKEFLTRKPESNKEDVDLNEHLNFEY